MHAENFEKMIIAIEHNGISKSDKELLREIKKKADETIANINVEISNIKYMIDISATSKSVSCMANPLKATYYEKKEELSHWELVSKMLSHVLKK